MSGTFEIFKDKSGEFRFRLNATNGQTILSSEGYKDKNGYVNGIESVQKNAPDDSRYEKKNLLIKEKYEQCFYSANMGEYKQYIHPKRNATF